MEELPDISKKNKADSIFKNCRIYDSDGKGDTKSAMAVKGGNFIAVGDEEEIQRYIGEETQIIDVKNRIVIPGLIDSHGHPVRNVMKGLVIFFSRHLTREQVIKKAKKFIKEYPDLPIYIGVGYKDGMFEDIEREKEYMDDIFSLKPMVFLSDAGGEAMLNSKAVEKSELDTIITAHIPKVEIIKNDEMGKPTGRIIGMDSVFSALDKLEPFDLEMIATRIEEVDHEYSMHGFTTVYDCGSYEYIDYIYLMALKKFWANKELRHKFFGTVLVTTLKGAKLANRKLTHKRNMVNEFMTTATVNTLRLKYDSRIKNPDLSLEAVRILTIEAANKGFNIQFDTINSNTTGEIIKIIKDIRKAGFNKVKISFSSGEKIDKEYIKELVTNGISINSNKFWDNSFTEEEVEILKEMKSSGVTVAFGADFGAAGRSGEKQYDNKLEKAGFKPADIVNAFTVNGAGLLNMEDKLGSISEGKQADFVILEDEDFFNNDFDLTKIKSFKTFVNGKCVYSI